VTKHAELRIVEGRPYPHDHHVHDDLDNRCDSHHDMAFLTCLARTNLPLGEAADELFSALAAVVAERGIQPVQEKLYGLTGAREEVLSSRKNAYAAAGLATDLPCSYHQGIPIDRLDFAGAQLWGVIPRDDGITVTTTREGRCWTGRDYRVLLVSGLRGVLADGRLAEGLTPQAEHMLLNADSALEAQGFSFKNVTRTWIYLKRILDWYGEFNRVRTAFFETRGVGLDAERSFPSSTGIQGTTAGEECCMDLLAVDGAGAVATPIHASSRQGRSFDYGSAFSRAMSLRIGGLDTVFVSGTASIDTQGATVHLDDPEAQILETLLCVSALLEPRGIGLKDVHLATVFCKTPEILQTYRQVVRLLGMPPLPIVPVVADICRPELLVEIEAIAVVPPPPIARPNERAVPPEGRTQ